MMKKDSYSDVQELNNEVDELPLIRISVRSLVEFILRSGDIDTRKGGGIDIEAMLAGGRIHRKIQKGKAGDYQAELSLFDEIDCGGYTLRIEGRADGVFTDDGDKEKSKRKASVKSGKKSRRKKKADVGLTEIELLIEEASHKAIINTGVDESLLPLEKIGGNDSRDDSMPASMCDDTKALPEDKAANSLPLVIVDEIKGIYMDPDELDEPIEVHLAQANRRAHDVCQSGR